MCRSGGVYLLTVLDWNTASWSVLIIGVAEVSEVLKAIIFLKCNYFHNIRICECNRIQIPMFNKYHLRHL